MTQAAEQQQQTDTGQQSQQQQPAYVTKEQLDAAIAGVRPTRTHVAQPQQTGDASQHQSLLDAINAQPERIVNAIKEAVMPPKDDSKEQQAATQAKVEAGQDTSKTSEPPAKTNQQKFRDWWFGDK